MLDLPSQKEVCCLVFLVDASAPCVLVHLPVQIWPQISIQSGRTQHNTLGRLSFPFPTIHRCCRSSPSLNYRADHTRRVDSFVRLFWDGSTVQNNLQFPICRFPPELRSIPNHLTYDFHSLSLSVNRFKTKNVVRVLPERLDAVIRS